MNILQAIDDPNLFAKWFKDKETWRAWRTFLAALFNLPIEDRALYEQCTGRTDTTVATEAWLVCGRRAGKSFILALIAVYLACFHKYKQYLAPGERATILIIATDRKQARVIFRYVRAFLTMVPMLKRMVESETRAGFDLTNAVTIEVGTASYRSVRGYTVVAALCDEIAFWPTDDAAEPDYAILDAVRPGMATIPGSLLLCASSPYARRGALFDAHRRHYGKSSSTLVWQAPTRAMNPSVPQSVIDNAYERDAASAAAEYGAQFRSDIESFINREAIQQCVDTGIRERPPVAGVTYSAFVDPSGGSADSFTLAIAHKGVLDAVREVRPPFSPEAVVAEYAALLKTYRVTKVVGDRYAGEWPREQFKKHGVTYEPSAKPKSDLYRDLLPAINSQRVELLDHDRLVAQLVGLERRTGRGGRDSIDHAPGAHDDLANAVAGALTLTAQAYDTTLSWVGGSNSEESDAEWRAARLWQHIHGVYR